MTDLRSDVLEVIESARLWLSNEDVWDAARIWPLTKGGKRRAELTRTEVECVLADLVDDGAIELVDGRYRMRREIPKEDKQLSLF